MGPAKNYRTEVDEYESTVLYRTLLFHDSRFLRTLEQQLTQLTPNLFCRSIILVVFHNCVFHHISHIYQFCSIIACSIVAYSIIKIAKIPFWFLYEFFRGP